MALKPTQMLFECIALRPLGPYEGSCPSESQKILGLGMLSLLLDDKHMGDLQAAVRGKPYTVHHWWGFLALVVGSGPWNGDLETSNRSPCCLWWPLSMTVLSSLQGALPAPSTSPPEAFRGLCPTPLPPSSQPIHCEPPGLGVISQGFSLSSPKFQANTMPVSFLFSKASSL